MTRDLDISTIDPIVKFKVLLEALPYIQRFRSSTFVIKFGGSLIDMGSNMSYKAVLTDIVFLSAVGINVVIVHGGGKAISRAMEKAKLKPNFKSGMRVTDKETIDIVENTLNHEVSELICDIIHKSGGLPMKVEGTKVFTCSKLKHVDENNEAVDLGFVGKIDQVNDQQIHKYTSEGYMPIISCVGSDEQNQTYNINADVAASAVASAVHARRLIYLCDVPGLLKDPEDPDSLISTLHINEAEDLKKSGIIGQGMLPKVDSAINAIENGVRRVHFIDGNLQHSLLLEIFTDKGIGTEIVQDSRPWRPKPPDATAS